MGRLLPNKNEVLKPTGIADFSKKAINKAVLTKTIGHPVTVYSVVSGLLGVVASVVFEPSLYILGIAISGLTLGASSWIINYFFRSDTFAERYIKELSSSIEKHKVELLKKVGKELRDFKKLNGIESYATQGAEQFIKIQSKFNSLKGVLTEKLDVKELTYGRYLAVAEQVYLSVLDNLTEIVTLLTSINAI
ncbi:MAG: hypothetical protein L3V56_08480, partial [Candidatus Magnetoovum sp. WYHC-5]|nr:hypothetical protein [Candidatus Magnetoovum sp. WYHC-5]